MHEACVMRLVYIYQLVSMISFLKKKKKKTSIHKIDILLKKKKKKYPYYRLNVNHILHTNL